MFVIYSVFPFFMNILICQSCVSSVLILLFINCLFMAHLPKYINLSRIASMRTRNKNETSWLIILRRKFLTLRYFFNVTSLYGAYVNFLLVLIEERAACNTFFPMWLKQNARNLLSMLIKFIRIVFPSKNQLITLPTIYYNLLCLFLIYHFFSLQLLLLYTYLK